MMMLRRMMEGGEGRGHGIDRDMVFSFECVAVGAEMWICGVWSWREVFLCMEP